MVRRELLQAFPSEIVGRDLFLGKVIGDGHTELEEWLTFQGRHRLIVRGRLDPGARICEECGRQLYSAGGRPYLFPAPPPGADVFESDLRGLIVTESLFQQIDLTPWKKLRKEKLPVLEAPLDGLGVLQNA